MQIKNHRLHIDGQPAPYRPTPNRSSNFKPTGIVVHDTAGRLDPGTSVDWLCNRQAKASAHVVVERDSSITQLAPLNVATWHAGRSSWQGRRGCNQFSFGIEIVNPGFLTKTNSGKYRAWFKEEYSAPEFAIERKATPQHGDHFWMDYSPAKIKAVFALCHVLSEKYGLSWIAPHWQVSPGRKIDTNPLFPLEQLRSRVFGRKASEPADDVMGAGETGRIVVSANLRRWPSYADNVIRVLLGGTQVEIERSGIFNNGDNQARWFLVRAAGQEGWVHGSLIDLEL